MKKTNKITTIGGGSGQFILLSALRDFKNVEISAVVSMLDSGGSTGRLRDELGVLPPGDILKCLLALSPHSDSARRILHYRFNHNGRLSGHSAGNLFLTTLSQYSGSFPEGVKALGDILGVRGKVLPVTIDKATLVAELTSGERVYGETAIDLPNGYKREKIKTAYLVPHHSDKISVYPPVLEAIKGADYIIIGPGDLYTSIVPNFLVPGVKEAIKKSQAKIIYILNIMTKFGETDNFRASNFLKVVERSVCGKVDFVIVNKKLPDKKLLQKYSRQNSRVVKNNLKDSKFTKVICEDLLEVAGEILRHDDKKLGEVIKRIIAN